MKFGFSVGCSPIHVKNNISTSILPLVTQIRQLPFKIGSENIMPAHWALLGIIVVSILSHWFAIPVTIKKDFSVYYSLFYKLTRGCLWGTNSFCLSASLLLTRLWSDVEGCIACLLHELSKEIKLAHQDTRFWIKVSYLRLTSNLYSPEPLGLNGLIMCNQASLSYRVSKPLLIISTILIHLGLDSFLHLLNQGMKNFFIKNNRYFRLSSYMVSLLNSVIIMQK